LDHKVPRDCQVRLGQQDLLEFKVNLVNLGLMVKEDHKEVEEIQVQLDLLEKMDLWVNQVSQDQ
jgi:hypothetical protein